MIASHTPSLQFVQDASVMCGWNSEAMIMAMISYQEHHVIEQYLVTGE
jgi:hypothetical protein